MAGRAPAVAQAVEEVPERLVGRVEQVGGKAATVEDSRAAAC